MLGTIKTILQYVGLNFLLSSLLILIFFIFTFTSDYIKNKVFRNLYNIMYVAINILLTFKWCNWFSVYATLFPILLLSFIGICFFITIFDKD